MGRQSRAATATPQPAGGGRPRGGRSAGARTAPEAEPAGIAGRAPGTVCARGWSTSHPPQRKGAQMNLGPLTVGTGPAPLPVAPSAAGASRTKEASASAAGSAGQTPPAFLDLLLGAGSAGAARRAEELGGLLTRFVRTALTGAAAASTTTNTS